MSICSLQGATTQTLLIRRISREAEIRLFFVGDDAHGVPHKGTCEAPLQGTDSQTSPTVVKYIFCVLGWFCTDLLFFYGGRGDPSPTYISDLRLPTSFCTSHAPFGGTSGKPSPTVEVKSKW